jgi:hypothetical protein
MLQFETEACNHFALLAGAGLEQSSYAEVHHSYIRREDSVAGIGHQGVCQQDQVPIASPHW